MAVLLKRHYELLALKIALFQSKDSPGVALELEVNEAGVARTVERWELSAESLGLPARFDRRRERSRDYRFHLDDRITRRLSEWVSGELQADGPLWLHLVKPYGFLGLVPWEQLLQPALGIPLLRLPDFLPSPRESRQTLDVLLCASEPVAKTPFEPHVHVLTMARQIKAAVPRKICFHVFVDARFQGILETQWRADPALSATESQIYPAALAERYKVLEASDDVIDAGRLETPWLLWMRDALGGRSVDVAHFLGHGFLTSDRGALCVSESPLQAEDRTYARFIGPAQLDTFLTKMGAWSVAFSSPPHNYSELGLRLTADTLAQRRSCALLFHDLSRDMECRLLNEAYRFLYSPTPSMPPSSPDFFMYCQPNQVVRAGEAEVREVQRTPDEWELPETPALTALFEGAQNVPSWVATTERYIERCQAELRQLETRAQAGSSHKAVQAQALKETLGDMRRLLNEEATRQKNEGQLP